MYNFKTDKYVGVFAHRYIRQWAADTQDINKVKKQKLPKNIHELVSIRNNDLLVLYTDGTCISLHSALAKKPQSTDNGNQQPLVSDTEQIAKVQTFESAVDSTMMLIYFVKQEHACDVVCQKLDMDTLAPIGTARRLPIARQKTALVGYAVIVNDTQPTLVTVWSDKRIFMQSLSDDITPEIPGNFVAMLNTMSIDQPLTVANVMGTGIAIYGANASQEGGSLVLFNSQFTIVQLKQFFKVYFRHSSIWALNNYILLGFGDNLACISFEISKERLSHMVGTQRTSGIPLKVVDQDFINEEQELEEMICFDEERQSLANRDRSRFIDDRVPIKERHTTNEEYRRGAPIESIDKFDADLEWLCRHEMSVEITRATGQQLDNVVQTKVCANAMGTQFNAVGIELLVGELEQYGASEIEITDTVVPLLIKAKLTNELRTCVRRYLNISDRMLVRAMKYFLDNKDSSRWQSVNIVLSCSFSDVGICEWLRTILTFNDAVDLLSHIADCLKATEPQLESRPSHAVEMDDEDRQLLAWFTAVLDAHFQQMILSKDVALMEKISEWKDLIGDQLTVCRELSGVSAKLYSLINGKGATMKSQSSKWYSIELVKLY